MYTMLNTHAVKPDEEPCVFSSDGGLRQSSSHADLTASSSKGAKPEEATSDVSASSGRPRKLFQRIRKFFGRVKNSDGERPPIPAALYTNGQIPPVSDEEHPNVFSSDGGLRQSSSHADLTASSSEGVKPKDATSDVSASSGRLRKSERIGKFSRLVKNSDRKRPPISAPFHSEGQIPPVSDEEHPNVFSSDGGLRQSSSHADLTASSSKGAKPDEEPCVFSSDGGLCQSSSHADLTASSSEGAKPKDATPDVSASSGHPRKSERIGKFSHLVKNSDRKRSPISAPFHSEGQIPPVSDEEHPNVFSSDGGLRQSSSHADLTASSSEGAKPEEATSDVSASSGRSRKLFPRIRKFFGRVRNSDGERPPISAALYTNGQIPPVLNEGHPNVFSSCRRTLLQWICKLFRPVKFFLFWICFIIVLLIVFILYFLCCPFIVFVRKVVLKIN